MNTKKITEAISLINDSIDRCGREQVIYALNLKNGQGSVTLEEYHEALEVSREHALYLLNNGHAEEGFNLFNVVNAADQILWFARNIVTTFN